MAVFGLFLMAFVVYALFLPKRAQDSTNKVAVRLVRGKQVKQVNYVYFR